VDVMLRCKLVVEKGRSRPVPCLDQNAGELEVIPILLPLVSQLSSLRLVIPKDLRPPPAKQGVAVKIKEVFRRFSDGVPTLDPVQDMKIQDEEFVKLLKKHESLEERLKAHPLHTSPDLPMQLAKYKQRLDLDAKCAVLRTEIANKSQDVVLRATLKGMKRVLRRLGFTTVQNVIDLKGRVACEISTGDELLVTELMFGGLFNDLAPDQIVALCSCLVFDEKSDEKVVPKDELQAPLRQLHDTARRVAQAILDSKLPIDVEEYTKKFQPHLMDIVLAWCRGAKFLQICKMSDIFEGSIIRTLRRLEELLRQLSSAAKVIGNELLETKFSEGRKLLKRDIVFAASLYL
jgi:ATP-dependent RNA helicase DOB1